MDPPVELRLCLVGRNGVGKRSMVSVYGKRNDEAFNGNIEGGSSLVSSATCQVKLNYVNVLVRLDALSDWADIGQLEKLMRCHRALLVFDMYNDCKFEGAGELTRVLNQMSTARGVRLQYDIVGTKADLCESAGLSQTIHSAAHYIRSASRFAVTTSNNGDSIVEAINKIILTVHSQLIASTRDTIVKTRVPTKTSASSSNSSNDNLSYQLDKEDKYAPLAQGVYPQLSVVAKEGGGEGGEDPTTSAANGQRRKRQNFTLANNPLDPDLEIDEPVTCVSCLQS